MYTSFYGFRERPFDLTPSPRFLYMSSKHREALSNIHYGIFGRKGITLLVGEAGTGKTTLVKAALAKANENNACCVALSNPTLTRKEFFEFLAAGFGLSSWAGESKARFLIELQRLVIERQQAGQAMALIVDEAQSLPLELMEEVRLLANLETDADRLFPVVLVGQPPLATCLELPELRQLKQRVALRCDLGSLDLRETGAYIAGRIRVAGGDVATVFTRDAVVAIYERSGGIPRTISVICDNALVSGFAGDIKPIGRDIVLEVCRDFRLKPVVAADTRRPELVRVAREASGTGHGNGHGNGTAVATSEPPPPRDQVPTRAELFAQLFRRRRFLFL